MSESKAPEFEPPQACVSRIIKNVLPDNVQITKDARAAFTRAAGIFIFYLTHCANEFSREGKRMTISTQDVFNALRELDFDDFEEPLTEFLEKYRKENETKKRSSKGKSSTDGAEGGDDEEEEAQADQETEEKAPVSSERADTAEGTKDEEEDGEEDDGAMQDS